MPFYVQIRRAHNQSTTLSIRPKSSRHTEDWLSDMPPCLPPFLPSYKYLSPALVMHWPSYVYVCLYVRSGRQATWMYLLKCTYEIKQKLSKKQNKTKHSKQTTRKCTRHTSTEQFEPEKPVSILPSHIYRFPGPRPSRMYASRVHRLTERPRRPRKEGCVSEWVSGWEVCTSN